MHTINAICGAVANAVFAALGPLGPLATLIVVSGATGILLLFVYRHASNQAGIKQVRSEVTANLLAIKLYRDELSVMFRSQRRLLWATVRLMGYQVKPLLVMIVPMTLLLAQMAMWYQFRPFRTGEPIVIKITVRPGAEETLTKLSISDLGGLEAATPAVRIAPEREYVQRFVGRRDETHSLRIGDASLVVPVAVGNSFERVRPVSGETFWDLLLYPGGSRIPTDSAIARMHVAYPERKLHVPVLSWLFAFVGLDHWLMHFFVLSTVVALLVRPLLGVHL